MLFRALMFSLILLSGNLAIAKTGGVSIYNQEVITALDFLVNVPVDDRKFILFFSLIGPPSDKHVNISSAPDPANPDKKEIKKVTVQDATPIILSFVIHSLSGGSKVAPPVKVSDTLYYVDFRDYDWTQEAIEKIQKFEPYFRTPWVDEKIDAQFRIVGGNNIFRADWFIVHTTDLARQVDLNIPTLFYYELLYAKSPIGIPKNDLDFQKIWLADINKIEDLELSIGRITGKGRSIVSRHNRQLYRARTEVGYYWHTMDVKNQQNGNNYVENLDPGLRKKNVDAGEIITNNRLGLNVYLLVNGKGERVEFADTTLVIDNSDASDRRVRTPKSCMICHSSGINPAFDSWDELLGNGIELRVFSKDDADRIREFYTNPDFDEFILDDQKIFIRAVKRVTGLDSEQVIALYDGFIQWYDKNLDLKQAAYETGVTEEEFKEVVQNTARGELGALTRNGKIGRENWEELKTGAFAESMLWLTLGKYDPKAIDLVQIPATQEVQVPQNTVAPQETPNLIHPPYDLTANLTERNGYTAVSFKWKNGNNPDAINQSVAATINGQLLKKAKFPHNQAEAIISPVNPGETVVFSILTITKRGDSEIVSTKVRIPSR